MTALIDFETFRDKLHDVMPQSLDDKIDEIVEYVSDALAEADRDDWIDEVSIIGARVITERIRAYGLDIGLDTTGNAVAVFSEYGFEVVE